MEFLSLKVFINNMAQKYSPEISAAITEAVQQAKEIIGTKVKSINWLMGGVVIVVFVAFLTLVIDSFHFNSAAYTNYDVDHRVLNEIIENNKQLMKMNMTNQAVIKQNQEAIQEFLKKLNQK